MHWLDFHQKTKICKFLRANVQNCDEFLSDLAGLLIEEMSNFFEAYLAKQFSKLSTLGEHDFLTNKDKSESLGDLKNHVLRLGNETTAILKSFALFCQNSLAQVVGKDQVPSFFEILLDIVVSRGRPRQRFALRAPRKLGQGMFPRRNMYLSYFNSRHSSLANIDPKSSVSLGHNSKSNLPESQHLVSSPDNLSKTTFPSLSRSLEFLIAARVLSNIDESSGLRNTSALQSKLLGHFFSFSGSVLYRLFQVICSDNQQQDHLAKLNRTHREFLEQFFAKHEQALTQREHRAVLVLLNFVNSAVFCVNQLSVVGQTKQHVPKMSLLQAHPSVTETDMLIARETLVFESSPNTVR